jgi:D-psicose/D-tagatose/L-ribulose 3-epimerase
MNKIGMNMLLWGVDIDSSHIPIFEQIKRAGFDGVEIPVLGQPASELAKLRDAVESLELECTAVTFVTPDVNPIDPDPAIRAAAVSSLKQRADECAAIGSTVLGGGIYQAHKYFVGRPRNEQEWAWSAEYLRAAGEHAAGLGVRLCLEVLNRFEVYLINTVADAARMVEDVGLDNVGIHYDTHHANIEEPRPGEALAPVRDELLHVHLSESHRGTLGTGQVDWDGNFAALAAVDYTGWLVVEAFGTLDSTIVQAANVWRNAYESEEQLVRDAVPFIRDALARRG